MRAIFLIYKFKQPLLFGIFNYKRGLLYEGMNVQFILMAKYFPCLCFIICLQWLTNKLLLKQKLVKSMQPLAATLISC